MSEKLRAGVAGAGVFGGYHANKYIEVAGCELVGIYDADGERAAAGAAERNAVAYTDYSAFLEAVDVVTIATPASTHGDLALKALESGKSVLVEKPVAMDLAMADRLIAAATANDAVLQVGHQERYVAEAFGLLGRPGARHVRSRRLNKFSGRAMDVSVIFDLMIHDLDLLMQISGEDPDAVELTSVAAQRLHGDFADYVDVQLAFPSGLTAHLQASRVQDSPLRDLLIQYEEGEVGLDFLGRLTRNTTSLPLAVDFQTEDRPQALIDPLRLGTEHFVNAVAAGTAPMVTGAQGRATLALALKIETAAMAALEN